MLVGEAGAWRRPPTAVAPIRIGLGENLFTQSDRNWARLQPAVAPTLRRKTFEARLARVDAIVDEEVRAFPTGATIDLDLAMSRIALRLAAWVLLGDELTAARAEELAAHQREVVTWVGAQMGRLSGFLPIAPGRQATRMKQHRAALNAYGDDVLARARAGHPDDDVLGSLLRARPRGHALSPRRLRSHALGFFLAGNETTAAALSWAIVQGAAHRDAWAALRADPDAHTDGFLAETLRLTPAVWGVPRTPSQPNVFVRSGAITTRVRRGQVATVYLRGIHRAPSSWSDPMRFDPTGHVAGGKEQPRALLPFGLGPRGCIGQQLAMAEMRAVLPALARRGDIVVDGTAREDPSFAVRVAGGLRGRFVAASAA
jgi:cytochrome P450